MPGTDLCIKLAKEADPKWEQYDAATKAASAILIDCLDRRGIKHQFNQCDEETLNTIVDEWADMIRTTFNN